MNDTDTVLKTKWFSIDTVPCLPVHRTQTGEPSSAEPYYRLSCNDSVEILAVTPQREVVMVRQFRPAVGMSMLELPAGYVDLDEPPEAAIRRELREETGYACSSVAYLGSFKIAPSRINNTLYLFYGAEARGIGGKDKNDRGVEVVLVSQEEFKGMISEGEFQEVAGIAAYFLAEMAGFL